MQTISIKTIIKKFGLVKKGIQGNMWMIRSMDLEFLNGLINDNIREIGLMVNNMEKECILVPMGKYS